MKVSMINIILSRQYNIYQYLQKVQTPSLKDANICHCKTQTMILMSVYLNDVLIIYCHDRKPIILAEWIAPVPQSD